MGARAGPRRAARRRQLPLPPGERGRRPRLPDHARDPRGGAPLEHAAADLHRARPRLRAAGVRAPALRGRARQRREAEQAQGGRLPAASRLREAARARRRDHGGPRRAGRSRVVQPAGRGVLPRRRLPARGPAQLPAAAGLVAGRSDGDVHDRGDDRAVHARAGQPVGGQLRSAEAAGVRGALHAAAAAGGAGGSDGAVPAAQRGAARIAVAGRARSGVARRRGGRRAAEGGGRHPGLPGVLPPGRRVSVRSQGLRQAHRGGRCGRPPGALQSGARDRRPVRRRDPARRHAAVHRGGGDRHRAHHPRRAGRGDRQGGGVRPVRGPGDSRPRGLPAGPHRPGAPQGAHSGLGRAGTECA